MPNCPAKWPLGRASFAKGPAPRSLPAAPAAGAAAAASAARVAHAARAARAAAAAQMVLTSSVHLGSGWRLG